MVIVYTSTLLVNVTQQHPNISFYQLLTPQPVLHRPTVLSVLLLMAMQGYDDVINDHILDKLVIYDRRCDV